MTTTDDYRGSARELLDWLLTQLDRIDERQCELDGVEPATADEEAELRRHLEALANDRFLLQDQLRQALDDRGLLAA